MAAALWGAATAFGRRTLVAIEPQLVTALRFTLALPLLAVIALYEGAAAPPADAHASDWPRLVGLALVPGLAALLLYYRGLVHTPASVATFAELAFPATALVVNYYALGASVSATQVLGFGILWATIALLHRLPVRCRRLRVTVSPFNQLRQQAEIPLGAGDAHDQVGDAHLQVAVEVG